MTIVLTGSLWKCYKCKIDDFDDLDDDASEGKSFNYKRKPIREKTEIRPPQAPAPTERGR